MGFFFFKKVLKGKPHPADFFLALDLDLQEKKKLDQLLRGRKKKGWAH